MTKNIGFVSLGCAKNLTDTETMLGILKEHNFNITAEPKDADILVVNTCAFIDSAKEESINAILEMAQYKEDKCELLIVTGCLAQRYKTEIEEQLPEVDIILGTTDYSKIADAIFLFYEKREKVSLVGDADTPVDDNLPRFRSSAPYTAYIKIADGCDNHCTYCIIPKLRGKFRSRSEESIIKEVKNMAAEGVKELILVAQDTAYYGMDKKEHKLASLLRKISEIDGIEWIRLQYCYPENITEELVEEIASNKKIVKYLDIPLQHVSDNVLRKMGRKSRYQEIVGLISKMRNKIPNLSIRTSLIVGFPGETDEDFNILKDFLLTYKLDKVGVFTYSREEDTPAYNFENQVSQEVSENRRDILMTVQKDVSKELVSKKIGSKEEVIIEGYDEEEFCYVGRSSTDTPEVDGAAFVYSERELKAGDIVTCTVIDSDEYDIVCKLEN